MKQNNFILTMLLFTASTFAQTSQAIRGKVIDNSSNLPLPYAAIVLLKTEPLIGITSDTLGNFSISNLPVGRYDVQVNLIGYETAIIR